MIRTSSEFQFMPPSEWDESNDRGRLVYTSAQGEVLVVSAAAISGEGSEIERTNVCNKLLKNALASVMGAVKRPELRVTRELGADDRASDVECWTVEAETIDGKEVFFQSVFRSGASVLLVTFEGNNSPAARIQYDQFVRSITRTM